MLKSQSRSSAVLAGLLVSAALGMAPATAEDAPDSVGPLLWQPSMNVFRRHAVPAEEMFEFYGGVLGLEQLQTFNVGGTTGVARFRVGNSEVKLTGRVPNREYVEGGVADATGLRLLTFYFPDKAELVARFEEHGYTLPEFQKIPGTNREVALVTDPDGQAVELIVAPNEPAETYDLIEVGVTVSDLEESRAFYREFVGLEELPPRADVLFDTQVYPYRHGSTIVNLRSFGDDLPKDTGSGGIQYVVTSAEAVDKLAKERNITIDQPLSPLAGFNLRTIWLDDPDGITNYFAQTGQSGAQSAQR